MRFQCPGCQVAFTVPDEKIPEGRGLKILCPKCRAPIEVRDRAQVGLEQERMDLAAPAEASGPLPGPQMDYLEEETQAGDSIVDIVEEGVKTCLLCVSDPARLAGLERNIRQLDFYVVSADRIPAALAKLHNNRYDLVVVDETFDGAKPNKNLVLQHIQFLTMHVRRQFFLCLLSEELRTLDQMTAFRLGVDMLLNAQDLEKSKIMLVKAMKDHEAFYKAYREELGRKGQF